MTPGDVIGRMLNDTRLDNTSVNAAMSSWEALVTGLRSEHQRSRPLLPAEIARARVILQAMTDALNRAAAGHPNRLRLVKAGDEG